MDQPAEGKPTRRHSVARSIELFLAMFAAGLGVAASVVFAVMQSHGAADPDVCGGYGRPGCPPSAAAVIAGGIATAFVGSLLPAVTAAGAWLHARRGEGGGLAILGFASVVFGVIGVTNYFAGGFLALPSAALGVLAFFAGIAATV